MNPVVVVLTLSVAANGLIHQQAQQQPLSFSKSTVVDDIAGYCVSAADDRVAAVYAVFDEEGQAQYVGMARDIRSALARHAASQPSQLCHSAQLVQFPKPSRDAMRVVVDEWTSSLSPALDGGEECWERPALSPAEADRKLKLRQAVADATLRDEDPEAWSKVVRKAMKDGDFDGSAEDLLDSSIESDELASRRLGGDWMEEVRDQTAEALRPSWQTASIEVYVAPDCPHCDRVRDGLRRVGAHWDEFDVSSPLPAGSSDDQRRRARHALFETVPKLYVLRSPPLNGRPAEFLVESADEFEKILAIPETTAFSFKGRISDPQFI